MPKILHESVVGVLNQIGIKPMGKSLTPANNRAHLRESQETLEAATTGVTVHMQGHPHLSKTSWPVSEGKDAGIKQAQAACAKAGGFAIIEAKGNDIFVSFTKDKAKAKVTEAKVESEEDETDGTGEASGDTTTNTKGKNDKGVGTKKGTKADNKGEENSEEVHESAADAETKPIFLKPGGKEKLQKMMARKKELAAKKDKTPEEVKEEAELDAALDQISEQFYESLDHSVTFVLYPEGKAEIHGIKEDELAPFGGTAPAVPKKYAKKAKDAGPNSKVDMGVLSIYKIEGMDAQSAKILTGKDFKAQGWGTPGKGQGKVAGWQDTGKAALDAKKDLKAGTQS